MNNKGGGGASALVKSFEIRVFSARMEAGHSCPFFIWKKIIQICTLD